MIGPSFKQCSTLRVLAIPLWSGGSIAWVVRSQTVMGLQARGINFQSLTEHVDTTTPGGKFTFHLFGARAEIERDVIRQRTKAGLKQLVREGVPFRDAHEHVAAEVRAGTFEPPETPVPRIAPGPANVAAAVQAARARLLS